MPPPKWKNAGSESIGIPRACKSRNFASVLFGKRAATCCSTILRIGSGTSAQCSMENRFKNWVDNLAQDWCISRQRHFGVPFPVWYPLDQAGEVAWDHPILADAAQLPVDPRRGERPGLPCASLRPPPAIICAHPFRQISARVLDTELISALNYPSIWRWSAHPPFTFDFILCALRSSFHWRKP